MARMLVLIGTVMALVACSSTEPSAPIPAPVKLGVSNGTTLTVSLLVNGRLVGVFPAGGPESTIDPANLPPLPWSVEAKTAGGRILTSMTVHPGQVSTTAGPGGEIEHSGTVGRVDLSCGRVTIWAGDVQPSGPAPMPVPGLPGDCAP